MVSYATLTSVKQAQIVLTMGQRGSTAAVPSLGGSTVGRKIVGTQNYATLPAPGALSEFAPGEITNYQPIVRTSVDPSASPAGFALIGNTVISNFEGGSGEVQYSVTPIPSSGGSTEAYATLPFSPGVAVDLQNPMPMLDDTATLRATLAFAHNQFTDVGDVYLLNSSAPAILTRQLWQGYDATINGYGGQIAVYPDTVAVKNRLMFSGPYIGSGNRPLLITAALNGTEPNPRFFIKLDDPVWDAVLAQPVATRSVFSIWPCNAGWFACFGIDTVNPPTFILFNPDCTEYWIYTILANDTATLDAVFTIGWGTGGGERIHCDAPIANQGVGNEITISGAAGNPQLLITNLGALAQAIMPPYPPIIPMKCIPCAPVMMHGGRWYPSFTPAPSAKKKTTPKWTPGWRGV